MNAFKCDKCGGFNISFDLETGIKFCTVCNANIKGKKFNVEEYKLDSIASEEKEINTMEIMGIKVKIDPNLDDPNEFNDFSKMGL